MKPLKPSIREHKRYLLIQGKNIKTNLENAILEFSGTLGMSKTSLNFIKTKNNNTILAINREALDLVRASIAVSPENIKILKVSGTIKGLGK